MYIVLSNNLVWARLILNYSHFFLLPFEVASVIHVLDIVGKWKPWQAPHIAHAKRDMDEGTMVHRLWCLVSCIFYAKSLN